MLLLRLILCNSLLQHHFCLLEFFVVDSVIKCVNLLLIERLKDVEIVQVFKLHTEIWLACVLRLGLLRLVICRLVHR